MICCKRRVSKFMTCRLCVCQAVSKTGQILHAKYEFCRKVLKDLKTRNNNRVKATDALRTLPNFFFSFSCIHEVWRSECQILCTTTADKKKPFPLHHKSVNSCSYLLIVAGGVTEKRFASQVFSRTFLKNVLSSF
jgi:hypothetical protein